MTLILRRGGCLLWSSLLQRPILSVLQRYSSNDAFIDQLQEKKSFSPKLSCNESLESAGDKEILNTVVPVKKEYDALMRVDEADLVDVAPEIRPTFNLAAYANKSHLIQEMIKLGVDLTKWEKDQDFTSYILRHRFEDLKQHIIFLYDVGVATDYIGRWLSLNPHIFRENIDDLQVRINYLLSKKFEQSQISRIVSRNPEWLLHSTVEIDSKLGFFQRMFKLSNSEVIFLAAKQPKLITHHSELIKKRNFVFLEEMGFTKQEMKSLLLSKPKLWMAHYDSLMRRFDYIHNEMGLSHPQILRFPKILTSREFRIKQRHKYLKLLGRDQFDSSKPNYVSPDALVEGDDIKFCNVVAKTSVLEFNDFLKTL